MLERDQYRLRPVCTWYCPTMTEGYIQWLCCTNSQHEAECRAHFSIQHCCTNTASLLEETHMAFCMSAATHAALKIAPAFDSVRMHNDLIVQARQDKLSHTPPLHPSSLPLKSQQVLGQQQVLPVLLHLMTLHLMSLPHCLLPQQLLLLLVLQPAETTSWFSACSSIQSAKL